MEFDYRGVKANIPQDMLGYAREHLGIDIPALLKTSINRMLRIASQEEGNFEVGMQIMNPCCEPGVCDFHIRVCRKDD